MFSRIVVATDGTESGEAAVSFTTALAQEQGAVVRVVHVNELLVGGRGVAAESELEAMDIVDRAVARLRGATVDADGVHYLAELFHRLRPDRHSGSRMGSRRDRLRLKTPPSLSPLGWFRRA